MAAFCKHGNEPSGFIKLVISSPAERLSVSQERLCSMELINYSAPIAHENDVGSNAS